MWLSEAKEALCVDGTQVQGTQIRVSFAKETKPGTTPMNDATTRNNSQSNGLSTATVVTRYVWGSVIERRKRRGRGSHDHAKISRTIFVEGIEVEYTALEIAKFFSYCGSVIAVRRSPVKKDPFKNRVWVEFEAPIEAVIAVSCDGQVTHPFLTPYDVTSAAFSTLINFFCLFNDRRLLFVQTN